MFSVCMQKTNCVIGFAFFVYVSAAPCVLCIITVLHTWWAGIRMWRCCLSGRQSEATSCLEVGSSEFEELNINRYLIWLKAEEAPVCCCLCFRDTERNISCVIWCHCVVHQSIKSTNHDVIVVPLPHNHNVSPLTPTPTLAPTPTSLFSILFFPCRRTMTSQQCDWSILNLVQL